MSDNTLRYWKYGFSLILGVLPFYFSIGSQGIRLLVWRFGFALMPDRIEIIWRKHGSFYYLVNANWYPTYNALRFWNLNHRLLFIITYKDRMPVIGFGIWESDWSAIEWKHRVGYPGKLLRTYKLFK